MRELDHFDTTVRKTQDYWRGENFKPVIGSTEGTATTLPTATPVKRVLPVPGAAGESDQLLADWEVIEIRVKGRRTPDDVLKPRKAIVRFRSGLNGNLTAEIRTTGDSGRTVVVKLDPERPTKQIDFVDDRDRTEAGIYKLDGDALTLCFAAPGEPRPLSFTTGEEAKGWVIVMKRVK